MWKKTKLPRGDHHLHASCADWTDKDRLLDLETMGASCYLPPHHHLLQRFDYNLSFLKEHKGCIWLPFSFMETRQTELFFEMQSGYYQTIIINLKFKRWLKKERKFTRLL